MSAPDTRKRKTGGRRKGTPNKATVALREKFTSYGYDPADELVRIARDNKTSLELQINIHLSLLPYIYPKRKPVDDSSQVPTTTNVITSLDAVDAEVDNARAKPASEA